MDKFELVLIRPDKLCPIDSDDQSIDEAIYTIYPFDSDIIIKWNNFEIILNIKSDIGEMWSDIIRMLKMLFANKKTITIFWPSSSFFAQWDISVQTKDLQIEAYWTDIKLVNSTRDKLRKENRIVIDKKSFIKNWMNMVDMIYNDLVGVGYTQRDLNDLSDICELLNVYKTRHPGN